MSWVLNAKIHLVAKGLSATITSDNAASSQDKANAMIFLCHHLDDGLKVEYLKVKDPLELRIDLKERIVSQLKLCGETINVEDMVENRLTTFHASNVILQQQYHKKDFQKYSELISCLLVAEQHNALLMKNHEAHSTEAAPLPEENGVQAHGQPERRERYNNHRSDGNQKRKNQMSPQNNPSRGNCHRCGMKGHWKNECWAAKHLARLYQETLKRKRNEYETSSNARMESHLTFKNDDEAGPSQKYDDNVEANLVLKDDDFDGLDDITHLEVEDFFGDQN
ncbi:uncharacterized protein LOC107844416 [Capsicum annuum]|uniref:uncharacterized protein LOC107844416 n=1 Tax=Capsicum annuum TaxID=4072 RepID=UPI001FB12584|nr:uncharacterized protein LOC107844416 [Capsicum annuum]